MTVKELIEQLQAMPDDSLQVIIANNDGGSPLSSLERDHFYFPDSTWQGDLLGREDYDEEIKDEERDPDEGAEVVAIWAVN